ERTAHAEVGEEERRADLQLRNRGAVLRGDRPVEEAAKRLWHVDVRDDPARRRSGAASELHAARPSVLDEDAPDTARHCDSTAGAGDGARERARNRLRAAAWIVGAVATVIDQHLAHAHRRQPFGRLPEVAPLSGKDADEPVLIDEGGQELKVRSLSPPFVDGP